MAYTHFSNFKFCFIILVLPFLEQFSGAAQPRRFPRTAENNGAGPLYPRHQRLRFVEKLAESNAEFVDGPYDHVLLDSSHWMLYERPEEVAELIPGWLGAE